MLSRCVSQKVTLQFRPCNRANALAVEGTPAPVLGGLVHRRDSIERPVAPLGCSKKTLERGDCGCSGASLRLALERIFSTIDRFNSGATAELSTDQEHVLMGILRSRTKTPPALRFVHPYGKPVVGWPSDLESFSATDAEKFYKKYYVPANMVLTLVVRLRQKRRLFCPPGSWSSLEFPTRLTGLVLTGRSPKLSLSCIA
jgi:hypothetical protein